MRMEKMNKDNQEKFKDDQKCVDKIAVTTTCRQL